MNNIAQLHVTESNRYPAAPFLLLCLALAFATPPNDAAATIIAGPGTGAGTTTTVAYSDPYWVLDLRDSNEVVDHDLNGNRWIKQLALPTATTTACCQSGWSATLSEHISIADGPWTDWHEEILTNGWIFVTWLLWIDPTGPGEPSISGTGSTNSLDLLFPTAANSALKISKTIQCVSTDGCNGDFITIAEWPTKANPIPEPGVVLLLAVGLLGLSRRKHLLM